MDNRILNVNGSGREILQKAIELAFMQFNSSREAVCSGWCFSKEKGLMLNWSDIGCHPFPVDMNAKDCANWAFTWLQSEQAKTVALSDFCGNEDHDGHNSYGWQVYLEDWGHVGENRYALCAIKPAYMWHGK